MYRLAVASLALAQIYLRGKNIDHDFQRLRRFISRKKNIDHDFQRLRGFIFAEKLRP
jgi:hypothetical protein